MTLNTVILQVFQHAFCMLLTASNGGLIMGLLRGVVFCGIAIVALAYCIRKIFVLTVGPERNSYIVCTMVMPFAIYFLAQMPYTEYNLLYNYTWVDGKILGSCVSKGNHRAYEFEYYVDGKRYTNCNGSGEAESVKCPGGIYKVRVSKKVPDIGRIDFEQEVLK